MFLICLTLEVFTVFFSCLKTPVVFKEVFLWQDVHIHFCFYITTYYKVRSLNPHKFNISVGESSAWRPGSPAQRLARRNARCQLSRDLICRVWGKTHFQVVDGILFLLTVDRGATLSSEGLPAIPCCVTFCKTWQLLLEGPQENVSALVNPCLSLFLISRSRLKGLT